MRKSLSFLAMLVATAGALVSQVPAKPADTTASFWKDLGDSTLIKLVTEAMHGSTSIRVAEARLDATRASRRLSTFDLAPTVTANGSALRTRQSMAQVPGLTNPLPQHDLYDVGFDAAWELDLFGRVRRNVGAQGALASAAEYSLDDVQVTLTAEVARTYFELRGAQRQLAVALRNADNQRKTLALTEDRLAAGRGTAFDVARARAVLQLTLAATPLLQSQIATTRTHIAVLLGRTPSAVPADWLADGSLPKLPDSLAIGLPREAVLHRPDVLAADRQLAAQTLSVRAARADYLPQISLAASVGYTANRLESLTRTGTSRVLVGPVVSFPLLDLGRVRQRVSFAAARQDEAQAQYTATVLRALEEADAASVAYARARERLVMLESAVTSTRQAADLAQQRFEAGLTDLFQVLDSQRTLLDAENQLALAHTAAAMALVAVYRSVGGGR